MNVAALLQDSPSEDATRRRPQPPQHPPHTPQQPPPAPTDWPPYDRSTRQSQWPPSPYIRPDQPVANPYPQTSAPPPFAAVDSRTTTPRLHTGLSSPPNPPPAGPGVPHQPRAAPYPDSSPRTRPPVHPSRSSPSPRHLHDTPTTSSHPSPAMASLRPIETPVTPGSWGSHPGSSMVERDRERLGDSRIALVDNRLGDSRLVDRPPMDWPDRERRKQPTLAGPGTGAPDDIPLKPPPPPQSQPPRSLSQTHRDPPNPSFRKNEPLDDIQYREPRDEKRHLVDLRDRDRVRGEREMRDRDREREREREQRDREDMDIIRAAATSRQQQQQQQQNRPSLPPVGVDYRGQPALDMRIPPGISGPGMGQPGLGPGPRGATPAAELLVLKHGGPMERDRGLLQPQDRDRERAERDRDRDRERDRERERMHPSYPPSMDTRDRERSLGHGPPPSSGGDRDRERDRNPMPGPGSGPSHSLHPQHMHPGGPPRHVPPPPPHLPPPHHLHLGPPAGHPHSAVIAREREREREAHVMQQQRDRERERDRARDLSDRGRDLSDRGRELPDRARELPDRGRELPDRGRDLSDRDREQHMREREREQQKYQPPQDFALHERERRERDKEREMRERDHQAHREREREREREQQIASHHQLRDREQRDREQHQQRDREQHQQREREQHQQREREREQHVYQQRDRERERDREQAHLQRERDKERDREQRERERDQMPPAQHPHRQSSNPPPPQQQFQTRFHTQFVPGLSRVSSPTPVMGPGPVMGLGIVVGDGVKRERDIKRVGAGERDRDRDKKASASRSGGRERERERERERDMYAAALGGRKGDVDVHQHEQQQQQHRQSHRHHHHVHQHHHHPHHPQHHHVVEGERDVDVEMDEAEWDEGDEGLVADVKARVKVDLGTFVYPRVPFPYLFDLGSGLLHQEEEKEKEKGEAQNLQEKAGDVEKEEKSGEEGEIREGEKVNEKEKVKEENMEEGMNDKENEKENEKNGVQKQEQDVQQRQQDVVQQSRDTAQQQQQDAVQEQRPDEQFTIDVETRTTIIIPNGHIPLEKPNHTRPRIWGGGLIGRTRQAPNPYSSRHKRGSSSRRSSSRAAGLAKPSFESLKDAQAQGKKRPRRVYTDDSDLFLCAIHSGWVTWSGAAKARALGRDMRVEVRVLRCTGAGAGSIFAGGVGGPGPDGGDASVKEEVVGRFLSGWGERCWRLRGRKGLLVKEEEELNQGQEEDEGEDDPPENDGRGLLTAAWGSGHDGSAIEIVGVEFMEKGTARTAPSLGRRNRSQRLMEYTERRTSILNGHVPCTRFAGRKRRRGWDGWPVPLRRLPNATVLDVVPEVEEEEDHVASQLTTWKEEDELMNKMTMVFAVGITGDMRIGYKYVPSLIKEILFPSPQPSQPDAPPPRKRRRTEDAVPTSKDVDMEFGPSNGAELRRSIILETVKESYLLSPSVDSPESGEGRRYDICLILESEVVVEVDPIVVEGGEHPVGDDVIMGEVVLEASVLEETPEGAEQTKSTNLEAQPMEAISSSAIESVDPTTENPSNVVEPPKGIQPSALDTTPASTEPSLASPAATDPSPPKLSADVPGTSSTPEDLTIPSYPAPTLDQPVAPDTLGREDEKVPPHQPVQVLQRNLTESMFRFTWEGVKIVEGAETEWAIHVCNWKWAPPLR